MKNPFSCRGFAILLMGLAFFAGHTVSACPDFSGHYRSYLEDGTLLDLTATQNGCDRMVMRYQASNGVSFSKLMIFDGVYRVIFDEPHFKTVEAFSINNLDIRFSAELYNKDTGSFHTLQGAFTQDSDRNLIENKTIYSSTGQPLMHVGIVHTRIEQAAIYKQ